MPSEVAKVIRETLANQSRCGWGEQEEIIDIILARVREALHAAAVREDEWPKLAAAALVSLNPNPEDADGR